MKINHLDLFSGIGGFALAARQAGYEIDGHYYSDIDGYANKVYDKNFRGTIALGDITSIDATSLRRKHSGPWMVTGGFPCQDISVAGRRRGINGDRSGLWFEMHRIIAELRPELVVAENVPALCYRGLDQVLRSLADIGFDAEWQVVSAASAGAPHLRKRVWIVAYPSDSDRIPNEVSGQAHSLPSLRVLGEGQQPNGEADRLSPWAEWADICARGEMGGQPLVLRMADGIPGGLDQCLARIKACGNAIVPQVAERLLRQARTFVERRENGDSCRLAA